MWLYAYPVLLYVYRLRHMGERLGRLSMANEGIRGDLRIEPVEVGWSARRILVARLIEHGGHRELLAPLEHARLLRVRTGLLLSGEEASPRGRKSVVRCPQAWMCTAEPVPLERWPDRPSARVSHGFDPADDDLA